MTPPDDASAYYLPLGDGHYRPTCHVSGAWDVDQQHMGPVGGLLVHTLVQAQPRDDLLLSRVTFDIFGVLPMRDVGVRVHTVRPGRSIELVQAEMYDARRTLVRATGWWLPRLDTRAVAGVEAATMPGPDQGEPWKGSDTWAGGFIRSMEFQMIPPWRPGRAQVWLRPLVGLVDGEEASDLATYCSLVDTANGLAVREDPATCFFPNTDLTLHLFRMPRGPWVGLDVAASFGPDGVGLTASGLHDTSGPLGRSEQILTVRPRAEAR